jgi:hypothetical protein
MGRASSECRRSKNPKPKPMLNGKKARFVCTRCQLEARKKKQVCKPRAA